MTERYSDKFNQLKVDGIGVGGESTCRRSNKHATDTHGTESANGGGEIGVIWVAVHKSSSQGS